MHACTHVQEVATAHIKIRDKRVEWKLTVGVVPVLPVPLLFGQDRPGFPQAPFQDVYLAVEHEDAETRIAESESHTTSNPLLYVFKQVICKEQEQNQDERLKNCWGEVCLVKGEDQQPVRYGGPVRQSRHSRP